MEERKDAAATAAPSTSLLVVRPATRIVDDYNLSNMNRVASEAVNIPTSSTTSKRTTRSGAAGPSLLPPSTLKIGNSPTSTSLSTAAAASSSLHTPNLNATYALLRSGTVPRHTPVPGPIAARSSPRLTAASAMVAVSTSAAVAIPAVAPSSTSAASSASSLSHRSLTPPILNSTAINTTHTISSSAAAITTAAASSSFSSSTSAPDPLKLANLKSQMFTVSESLVHVQRLNLEKADLQNQLQSTRETLEESESQKRTLQETVKIHRDAERKAIDEMKEWKGKCEDMTRENDRLKAAHVLLQEENAKLRAAPPPIQPTIQQSAAAWLPQAADFTSLQTSLNKTKQQLAAKEEELQTHRILLDKAIAAHKQMKEKLDRRWQILKDASAKALETMANQQKELDLERKMNSGEVVRVHELEEGLIERDARIAELEGQLSVWQAGGAMHPSSPTAAARLATPPLRRMTPAEAAAKASGHVLSPVKRPRGRPKKVVAEPKAEAAAAASSTVISASADSSSSKPTKEKRAPRLTARERAYQEMEAEQAAQHEAIIAGKVEEILRSQSTATAIIDNDEDEGDDDGEIKIDENDFEDEDVPIVFASPAPPSAPTPSTPTTKKKKAPAAATPTTTATTPTTSTGKRRGRPPKSKPPAPEIPPTPKRRGRPPKRKLDTEETAAATPNTTVEPPKKKRGRPPKQVVAFVSPSLDALFGEGHEESDALLPVTRASIEPSLLEAIAAEWIEQWQDLDFASSDEDGSLDITQHPIQLLLPMLCDKLYSSDIGSIPGFKFCVDTLPSFLYSLFRALMTHASLAHTHQIEERELIVLPAEAYEMVHALVKQFRVLLETLQNLVTQAPKRGQEEMEKMEISDDEEEEKKEDDTPIISLKKCSCCFSPAKKSNLLSSLEESLSTDLMHSPEQPTSTTKKKTKKLKHAMSLDQVYHECAAFEFLLTTNDASTSSSSSSVSFTSSSHRQYLLLDLLLSRRRMLPLHLIEYFLSLNPATSLSESDHLLTLSAIPICTHAVTSVHALISPPFTCSSCASRVSILSLTFHRILLALLDPYPDELLQVRIPRLYRILRADVQQEKCVREIDAGALMATILQELDQLETHSSSSSAAATSSSSSSSSSSFDISPRIFELLRSLDLLFLSFGAQQSRELIQSCIIPKYEEAAKENGMKAAIWQNVIESATKSWNAKAK